MVLQKFLNVRTRAFIDAIVKAMGEIAPLELADGSWDNVGLLLESPLSLKSGRILLTNDLTSPVVAEAIENRADMIISYHPPWFKATKRLLASSGPLTHINLCLANGISIYSPHTALDSISGGSIYCCCRKHFITCASFSK
jgi:putative NIF3 family GTP cyclohydrolase 1 type 2